MDSGTAALIGTVIGSFASPLAAFAAEHFRKSDNRKADQLRRERLKKILLLPKNKWRPISYLAEAIGAPEEKTKRLLLEIDARKSLIKGHDNWALIDRVPFPDDVLSECDEGSES